MKKGDTMSEFLKIRMDFDEIGQKAHLISEKNMEYSDLVNILIQLDYIFEDQQSVNFRDPVILFNSKQKQNSNKE